MIIDITKLKSNIVDKIEIDEDVKVDSEYLKKSDIIDFKSLHVTGYITKDDIEQYNLNIKIYGTMVLPCSISLKPTNYDFETEIDDNIDKLLEEIGIFEKNSENTIDIFPIIWENILMEIPMRIVNENIEDAKLKGDGWRVVTEKDENESVNPELLKLKDLLK